jgi:two-component system, sensor histidine kinase and response regulator
MHKLSKELSLVGDISYVLDKNFTIVNCNTVDDLHTELFVGLTSGTNFLQALGLSSKKEQIELELKNIGKVSEQILFSGNDVLVEIISLSKSDSSKFFAYLNVVKSNSSVEKLHITSEMLDGFFWQSPSPIKEADVIYSPGITALTGYYPVEIEKLTGKYLSIIFYEDSSFVLRQTSEFLQDPSARAFELVYRIIRKDGSIRWVKENIRAADNIDSKTPLYVGIVANITKVKETEIKALESEAKLVEVNQAKDRFINILSHDLRAPFTSILGFAEILLNEANLPAKEKTEYLNYIYEASQNQLQFISYLLDWSRLRTGTLKIAARRIQAQALIYNCVSILTGNAIRKNIQINIDAPETLYIQADERLITQVILNLLSNALKFSFESSTIDISALKFNDAQAEIVVKDHGAGIAPEDQSKIFSIEKNYSKDGTKGEKGSGFGLALVKEIITKHGGEVWFYSDVDKGSEFHFTIPLPSNTILLIEHDHDAATYHSAIIKDGFPEFNILVAENGYEALSTIASQMPNLIITNHEMPLMSGIQFIESLKKDEAESKIPLIVFAEEPSAEMESQYYRLGTAAVISTTADKSEFVAALRKVLR